MNKSNRKLLSSLWLNVVLAFAVTSFMDVPGFGFTLVSDKTPDLLGWSNQVVQIFFDRTACPNELTPNLIMQAMTPWNDVLPQRIQLQYGGTSTASHADVMAHAANPNPVLFCDAAFSTDMQVNGDMVPAVSSVAIDTGANRIIYGYTVLNVQNGSADNIARIDDGQLIVIIAHEFGHILGLGHSAEPGALMYYDVSGKHQVFLAGDDEAGIKFIYTRVDAPGGSLFGCGMIQDDSMSLPKAGIDLGMAAELLIGFSVIFLAFLIHRPRKPRDS